MPKYQQIISALTWMSHAQNLRRVAAEHTIDLYLRPPVTRFRLMDYHLMERIVRDANRCRPRPSGRLWLLRSMGQKIWDSAPLLSL